jgi:predicted metal-dependent peptidase
MNQREYNSGYQAAIDAIRKQIQQQRKNGQSQQPSQGGQAQQGQDGRMMPPGMGDASGEGQQGQSSGQGQQSQGQGAGSGSGSRGSGNQGVVQPEDCIGPNSLDDVPGTAGGYIDRKTGDEIAKNEGYDKGDGGSDDQTARDWKDNALKMAKQLKQQTDKSRGGGPAAFAARLESIYKPTKDWRKELKRVVGQAITPDDPRQAFAHKNTLVSQDRIARADKDKYDSMDYMVAMVDTSGSMSEKDIKACLGEVYGVALAKKPLKLVLMYFGSGVSKIMVFKSLTEFKKEMKAPNIAAGGGTEVEPCFRMLATDPQFRRKIADIVMIFTDGYIDQVKRNPKICKNLCWVIVDNPGFDLQYKDIKTKCVHIKKEDME